MCKFFSLDSDGKGNYFYFNWKQRQDILSKKIKCNRFKKIGGIMEDKAKEELRGIIQSLLVDHSVVVRDFINEKITEAEFSMELGNQIRDTINKISSRFYSIRAVDEAIDGNCGTCTRKILKSLLKEGI